MAVTTFTGQNVGANRLDRVKKGMYSSLIMVLVYTVFIGAVLLIFSHQVLGLFTHSAQVIMYGQLAMKYFCPYYFLLGILNVLAGTVRGAGKGIPPMIILLFSMCIFRILWIKIALPFYSSIDGVFILYPISWLVGAILMILYTKFGKWLPHKQMEKKAVQLLKMFDIERIGEKYPAEISGGQKQRTAVARALINEPLMILADEPTGNLDSRSSEAVIDAFITAKKKLEATTLMVTHDSLSASYCDRVILMRDGIVCSELVNKGNRRVFFNELMEVLRKLNGGE